MNENCEFAESRTQWLGFIECGIGELRAAGTRVDGLERVHRVLSQRLENDTEWRKTLSGMTGPRAWSLSRSILSAETGLAVMEFRAELSRTEKIVLGEAVREGELFFEKKLAGHDKLPLPFDPTEAMATLGRARSATSRKGLHLLQGGAAASDVRGRVAPTSAHIQGKLVRLMATDGSDPQAGVRGVLENVSGKSTVFEAKGRVAGILRRTGIGARVSLSGRVEGKLFVAVEARPVLREVAGHERGER